MNVMKYGVVSKAWEEALENKCVKFCGVHCTLQEAPVHDTRSEQERCLAETKNASRSSDEELQSKKPKLVRIVNTIFKANKANFSGGGIYVKVGCFWLISFIPPYS